jgi:hypothetical protein
MARRGKRRREDLLITELVKQLLINYFV